VQSRRSDSSFSNNGEKKIREIDSLERGVTVINDSGRNAISPVNRMVHQVYLILVHPLLLFLLRKRQAENQRSLLQELSLVSANFLLPAPLRRYRIDDAYTTPDVSVKRNMVALIQHYFSL
jgi:hypothetical protein